MDNMQYEFVWRACLEGYLYMYVLYNGPHPSCGNRGNWVNNNNTKTAAFKEGAKVLRVIYHN